MYGILTRCPGGKEQQAVGNVGWQDWRESRAKYRDMGSINFKPIVEIKGVDDLQGRLLGGENSLGQQAFGQHLL